MPQPTSPLSHVVRVTFGELRTFASLQTSDSFNEKELLRVPFSVQNRNSRVLVEFNSTVITYGASGASAGVIFLLFLDKSGLNGVFSTEPVIGICSVGIEQVGPTTIFELPCQKKFMIPNISRGNHNIILNWRAWYDNPQKLEIYGGTDLEGSCAQITITELNK